MLHHLSQLFDFWICLKQGSADGPQRHFSRLHGSSVLAAIVLLVRVCQRRNLRLSGCLVQLVHRLGRRKECMERMLRELRVRYLDRGRLRGAKYCTPV